MCTGIQFAMMESLTADNGSAFFEAFGGTTVTTPDASLAGLGGIQDMIKTMTS